MCDVVLVHTLLTSHCNRLFHILCIANVPVYIPLYTYYIIEAPLFVYTCSHCIAVMVTS